MQDILSLKKLGFSLEEIKYFNKDSIKNKIDNYEKEILNLQDKISILKQFYITEENNNKMIFVNDEKAIGKWVLQGVSENLEEAQKENYIQDDYNIKELYLLPNGEEYWVISWTKDNIYINGIPYHYDIINNKLYLKITDDLDPNNFKIVVYNNINHKSYTKDDIKQKDDINISFTQDQNVIGTWQTVDFINEINSFNPNKIQSNKDNLLLDKLIFKDNGFVSIKYLSGKDIISKYTKDYIINLILQDTLSKYTYEELLGKKYIIVEWKSGDYVFGKVINGYYVLEKKN